VWNSGSGKERYFTAQRPIFTGTALCSLPLPSFRSHREISRLGMTGASVAALGTGDFPVAAQWTVPQPDELLRMGY
jgi:hypothetical protein